MASSSLRTEPGPGGPRSGSGLMLNFLPQTMQSQEQVLQENGDALPADQADWWPKYQLS